VKNILVIGTGGTIASSNGSDGLAPVYSPDALLRFVPEAFQRYKIDSIPVLNLDSTNMQPRHWMEIAGVIRGKYDEYDGFVITHGTDTLAYTAAMLSYLIQNSRKPIVITGSQKPMEAPQTDARKNLLDSIRFAGEDSGGVLIVFNGQVINGSRAVKVRTKSYNAFESINHPEVASIDETGVIRYNPQYAAPRYPGPERFFSSIDPGVMLIKLIPGVTPDIFDYIQGKYHGVVVESYGSGGVPFIGDANLLAKIEELADSGMIVVITTQCLFEGGNLSLYEVGRRLLRSRIIPAYDMTTEAAVTKLMWALGRATEFERVRQLFLTPVGNDLTVNDSGREAETGT
jgi:L-asparaginase